ncbi:MAG: phosphatase PAP2 family protein [Gammaproteobacteria bacterium]
MTMFVRVDHAERRICEIATSACRRRAVRALFRTVSRLGDGVVWYVLMAVMPLIMGLDRLEEGLRVSAQMLAAGAFGLLLYKLLKKKLVRERPYIGLIGIECAMPPLDRYSFPSGHTLHAVLFTAIAIHHVPALAAVLVPFALLVAASRVVLGLHYPTDVLAGAVLGALIAAASHAVFF